jgi:hypothetical protein
MQIDRKDSEWYVILQFEIFYIPDKAKPFVRGRRKADGSSEKTAGLPKDTLSECPAFFVCRHYAIRKGKAVKKSISFHDRYS